MKKIQFLIFPTTILLLMFLIEKKDTSTVYLDFCEAKKTSILEKKPLLIIFDKKSKEEINNNIKNIKTYVVCFLNYEENKKIIEEYNVNKIPSYIIIDNITNAIYKEEGYKNKKKLFEWLIKIKEKIQSNQIDKN